MTELEESHQAMKDYYAFMDAENAKITKSTEDFLSTRSDQFKEDFYALIEDVKVTNPIEVVDKAFGDDQLEEYGSFSKVLVNQRTGNLGDDFSGEIYALMQDGKWLKISYEC